MFPILNEMPSQENVGAGAAHPRVWPQHVSVLIVLQLGAWRKPHVSLLPKHVFLFCERKKKGGGVLS